MFGSGQRRTAKTYTSTKQNGYAFESSKKYGPILRRLISRQNYLKLVMLLLPDLA